MNFCAQCGQELQPGARFCGMCGTPVVAHPVPEPPTPAMPSTTVPDGVGSITPFEDLVADVTPELSELIEGILAASHDDPAEVDRLTAQAIQLDPVNANRMIAISLTSLADTHDADSTALLCTLGMDAYRYGDHEGALSMLVYAADKGNTQAMGCLAIMAQDEGDTGQAIDWWERAAQLGDARGMYWTAFIARAQGDDEADAWMQRAASAGDPYALNDLGRTLLNGPRRSEGLVMLEASARGGVPWAAANFTWHFLETGEYARAARLFEEVEPAIVDFVEVSGEDPMTGNAASQLANARSNAALCRLAMGEDTGAAVRVWNGGVVTGHAESMFYPLLVLWNQGFRDEAVAGYRALPGDAQAVLPATMEELAQLDGWPGEWGRLGLAFISNATR